MTFRWSLKLLISTLNHIHANLKVSTSTSQRQSKKYFFLLVQTALIPRQRLYKCRKGKLKCTFHLNHIARSNCSLIVVINYLNFLQMQTHFPHLLRFSPFLLHLVWHTNYLHPLDTLIAMCILTLKIFMLEVEMEMLFFWLKAHVM